MMQEKIRQVHGVAVKQSAFTQHEKELKKFKHDRWPVELYDMVRRNP